ncbi:MAG: hypothetical protein IT558_01845 [Alphaproteobacteria bacterium]|nr:hypothetical protein [Alphaproteobacteria bacterium]
MSHNFKRPKPFPGSQRSDHAPARASVDGISSAFAQAGVVVKEGDQDLTSEFARQLGQAGYTIKPFQPINVMYAATSYERGLVTAEPLARQYQADHEMSLQPVINKVAAALRAVTFRGQPLDMGERLPEIAARLVQRGGLRPPSHDNAREFSGFCVDYVPMGRAIEILDKDPHRYAALILDE